MILYHRNTTNAQKTQNCTQVPKNQNKANTNNNQYIHSTFSVGSNLGGILLM